MGFERAKIDIKPASVGTGVKVSLKKIKGAQAKMTLTFSGNVIKQLAWAADDKLEVLMGTDGDHGIIRLRKNNSVGDAVVVMKKAMGDHQYGVVQLGHHPRFVDRAEAARWCQCEALEDGYFEVVLPRWADETSPKKKPADAAVQTLSPTKLPQQRPASVTAGVMGDPPPGRREMLAKIGDIKA
ncbi:hypothetical protein [Pararhizobium sp.]|uniref:hypothetical protein n=1 Tax=Pararhizobium sp. TaxID=1977563 RepID=UPI00271AE89D|nr:hypothetical protein [Pararhizobium sp.]MDO9417005.1 hypothetical protein [Pararhizobium sp.]